VGLRSDMRTPYRLSATLAAIMLVQPLLGLLFQRQYRDEEWITAAWFGNDWVTLVVAVPLLVLGVAFAARGSTRGLLLWLGMIGYAAYNYAYYLFGAALNVFFPVYVVPLVLAVVILVVALSRVDVSHVAASFRPTTPARIIGGYFAFIGVGLALVWMAMWASYVFAGRPTPIAPEAFKLVAALDISVMATALGLGGILLWQRRAWGYIVATIAGIQGSMYLLVLSTNSLIAIHRSLAEAPGELPMWGTLAALTMAATLWLLVNSLSTLHVGDE